MMKPSEWLQSEGWVRMHSRIDELSDWRDPVTGKDYLFIEAIQIQDGRDSKSVQPCGHPLSAIVTNGTTSYCGSCADDSLRANIATGVEA